MQTLTISTIIMNIINHDIEPLLSSNNTVSSSNNNYYYINNEILYDQDGYQ